MRRNNRSRRGKIPQKEYTKHAIIRRTAQCLQGVEGILPKMVDEPTSALDPISTSKIEDLAMELKKDYTIVMVTHNMQDAIHIGNRLIMMHEGQIIYDVKGEEKKKLKVSDLLRKFEEASGEEFANDRMMLG